MTSQQKTKLRHQLLNQRRSLPPDLWRQKSDRLCQHLQSLPRLQAAKTVLAYSSFRQEPDLSALFAQADKQWGLPRCAGKCLIWHRWQPAEPLQKGAYGIFEPSTHAPLLEPQDADLILVPAIACDAQGYRLGYGGGFYDRLLDVPKWLAKPTIGIVFDFAFLPQLPTEPWDRRLQAVVTETGLQFNSPSDP